MKSDRDFDSFDESLRLDPELHAKFQEFKEWAHSEAERPGPHWEDRRRRIHAMLARRERGTRQKRWIWALALPALLIAMLLLPDRISRDLPLEKVDPDHELLVDVERSLKRPMPAALEPAAFLVQEVSKAIRKQQDP